MTASHRTAGIDCNYTDDWHCGCLQGYLLSLWLLAGIHSLEAWAQFQYKSCLFRYRGTHNKDEMLVLLPHLLTHWGRVTHICVSNLTIIGSDNGLAPARRQAIIWTNAGILLIGPCGTNFSEILIGIQTFSFKKIRLKMSSAKFRPFCLSLNVLMEIPMLVWWHVCNGWVRGNKEVWLLCNLDLLSTDSRIK